ncbi:MAG: hypothetical protein QF393_12210 [Rhodospirillales bacterium]|nr:hypothetical protein [Rhodospirillales bacterium]
MTEVPSQTIARMAAMTPEDMRSLQLAKLGRQLERVWASNPFYRGIYEKAGIAPEDIATLEDFSARVPTVGKPEFLADQEQNPPFGLRLGVPREEVVMVNLTGGTSGLGQEFYGRTAHDIVIQGHLHALPYYMAGLRRGDTILNCVPAGGMSTGGWGPSEGFRQMGGPTFNAGGTLGTDAKIDLMLRFGEIHFIYASTNYVHTLTEGLRRRGISPRDTFPMMRAIFFAAEGYAPEWRQQIEEFWGCRVNEGYGSTQVAGFGYVDCHKAGEPERGLLHALEWHSLLEVVDPDTGAHVAPGEEGEVLVTNLDIQASPAIRFRTGDRARYFPAAACSCGRPWHCIEAGSVGRYDDMLKIRGNNVWPITVDGAVFAFAEVDEYTGRVYVDAKGRTEVEVRLAFKPETKAQGERARQALLARIGEAIREKTNVKMTLIQVSRGELPDYHYKARRWRDERRQGYKLD